MLSKSRHFHVFFHMFFHVFLSIFFSCFFHPNPSCVSFACFCLCFYIYLCNIISVSRIFHLQIPRFPPIFPLLFPVCYPLFFLQTKRRLPDYFVRFAVMINAVFRPFFMMNGLEIYMEIPLKIRQRCRKPLFKTPRNAFFSCGCVILSLQCQRETRRKSCTLTGPETGQNSPAVCLKIGAAHSAKH